MNNDETDEKMNETDTEAKMKTCADCGRELPETEFQLTRRGGRMKTCKGCVIEKRRETRNARLEAKAESAGRRPVSDPMFDGKEPREVLDIMSAARRWLESRGFSIRLEGYYMQRRDIKF